MRNKSKEQRLANTELLQTFDKKVFFKYVEGYVLESMEYGHFIPGNIEWFIVDYFERFVFQQETFIYVPEFEAAIFELLQKHQDKLISFSHASNIAKKNAMFPPDKQIKYLTLMYPGFNPAGNLNRSMLEYEVGVHSKLRSFKNKAKAGLRRLLMKS